ncbi:MAG: hypothetical protein V7608_2607 [Hyphomicrobiales bacterium]|jgi:hypothetical protein
MRTVTTILAAAFIAGSATLAMAQGGGQGGAGGDVNPDRPGKGSDANPSSPGASPAAGNKDATTAGEGRTGGAMKTAPVSGTPKTGGGIEGSTSGGSSSNPTMAPTGTSK